MEKLLDGMTEEEIGDFVQPDDERFVTVQVCSQTGLLAGSKCKTHSVSLFASDIPTETCSAHQDLEIKLCYPTATSSTGSCVNDYCLKYHELITSQEYKALCILFPDLKRYKENVIKKKTFSVLKEDGVTDEELLEEALKENEIGECSEHSKESYQALYDAIEKAKACLPPPTSEPEPAPTSSESAPPQEP